LLDLNGRPMLTDFGLAIPESRQRHLVGELSGTPAYMSPEQVRGESQFLDGRTDVWSLGVILYEMLTGRRPFRGETSGELFDEIINREPKPPRLIEDRIPIELETVCLKALRKQIAERFTSARDFADQLRDAVAPYRTYKPSPINTQTVAIPAGLGDLIESLARNVHDNWAQQRIKEGWTRGPERNDIRMEHPCLVPFEHLPASEKEYDRLIAEETIKVILTLGYRIVGSGSTQPISQDTSHGPSTEC
jgi:serine/threonine protein kinase